MFLVNFIYSISIIVLSFKTMALRFLPILIITDKTTQFHEKTSHTSIYYTCTFQCTEHFYNIYCMVAYFSKLLVWDLKVVCSILHLFYVWSSNTMYVSRKCTETLSSNATATFIVKS